MLAYFKPKISPSLKLWTDFPFALSSLAFVTLGRAWWKSRWKKKPKSQVAGEGPEEWTGWSQLPNLADLRVAMIVCPRWNPHALSHNIGPFDATHSIALDVETLNRSATTWICSIYGTDGSEMKTLASCSEFDGKQWAELDVVRGQYGMALRYFGWRSDGLCPRIKIDGKRELNAARIKPEEKGFEDFLASIQNRRDPFFYFLHCSVLTALRLQAYLPPAFVRRLYLPFGNLQTVFHYGLISPKEHVSIWVAPHLRASVTVYIVFFNDCGFPITWQEVTEHNHNSVPAVEGATSYLTRSYARDQKITDEVLRVHVDQGSTASNEVSV